MASRAVEEEEKEAPADMSTDVSAALARGASDASKDVSNNVSEDVCEDVCDDVSLDVCEVVSKDVSKDVTKEVCEDVSLDLCEALARADASIYVCEDVFEAEDVADLDLCEALARGASDASLRDLLFTQLVPVAIEAAASLLRVSGHDGPLACLPEAGMHLDPFPGEEADHSAALRLLLLCVRQGEQSSAGGAHIYVYVYICIYI